MRIGIDYHVLHHEWQGSGIRRYIEGLYRAVLKVPSHHEWVFLVEDPTRVPQDWPGRPEWQDLGTTSRVARLGWQINRCIRKNQLDCCHMQFVAPLFQTCKEVVSVHDILFDTHPQFFPRSAPFTLAPLIRRSAHRASLILTISEYSKRMLMERWGISEERICLTPCAIDPTIFNPGDLSQSRKLVKETYDVEDYILSVGRIEPRKNHQSLVRSYADLKTRGKSLPKLVFVGGKDFGYRELAALIQEKGLEKDVVFLHSVSDVMLPHLYRAALVMAYPSFAEGFGIPPLEAMACGCPVITSGTTALPEVVGDSGWLIDPEKWPTISEALLMAIQDPSGRQERIRKGLVQATQYSWERSAKALLEAYDRLD
ncbi:glycosyltransferase family 1 protein [Geothrix sp. SG200]|uniref:glycosyltransferase family 4 protein n=1 Tax=Geothrix sp. SG200 TaxID=2922865 RepID=UPI001FAB50EF|nr:glycosyltransferase family 1 protein [Geothrix sp. SG200]